MIYQRLVLCPVNFRGDKLTMGGNRPNVGAMQRWADLVDDQSYVFDQVLPFFKRTIQFTPPNESLRDENATAEYDADAFEDDAGPVQVSYPNSASSFATWLSLAFESKGFKEAQGFSHGSILGSQFTPFTIGPSHQTRSGSDSFLWNSWTPFLSLYKNTMAKRILFSPQKQAIAVDVQTLLTEYTLAVNKEVILSAGAFQSPQLLMVSGIGPESTLDEYEIEVIVDHPGVGQNLTDHVFFGPTHQVLLETHTRLATDLKYLLREAFKYVTSHTGAFTNAGADYLAFEKLPESARKTLSNRTKSDLAWLTSDWPEVEVYAEVQIARFYSF
jgi:choline dehydrogenase